MAAAKPVREKEKEERASSQIVSGLQATVKILTFL